MKRRILTDDLPFPSAATGSGWRVTIERAVSGVWNSGADGRGAAGTDGFGWEAAVVGSVSSRLRKLVRVPKDLLDDAGRVLGFCAGLEVLDSIVGGWGVFEELGCVFWDLEE